MKNFMKKIIVGIFSLAVLFAAQNAFASTWNGASNDCRSISIANATTNEGYAYPCWPSSSVSADAGDTLNIRIYYHNTGTATANNTIVTLSAPIGGSASTSKSFSGNINSDQGGISLSSVTANLSSAQTITFNNVKWYTNNTSETLTSLPGGQSGSEILSGGLNLGSIAPGWATQGSLVVSFHVSNTTQPVNSCEIINFSASDTNIQDGDSTILRWNTTDCDHVKLSGYSGNVSLDGSKTVYPTDDTTYTLTAYDTDGTHQTDTVKIYVDSNNNNNNSNCSINSFTASDTYVNQGNPVTLRWNTSNCNNISVSTIGNVYAYGSQTIYPTYSTNYTLIASNYYGGSQTRSVYVTVNNLYVQPVLHVYNSCAVTTVATNVNQNGAQLNGIITSTVGANTYFEYGTSVNLGYRTNSRFVNGNVNFSDMVTGLSPYTIYYFRMVSDCQNGKSLGAMEVFRTLGTSTTNNNTTTNTTNTTRTVVVQGTTVVGTASPILLNITNKYELIGQGDLIDYVVDYKNIGGTRLTRPMVQVVLPTNFTLINASRGTYSVDDHTLSAPLEDLEIGQEGVIYLQARVDSVPLNNSQIVTTAILVYTSANGSQENAMAYVLNAPKITGIVVGDSTLTGNAFFAGLLSIGLLGWLLILLLILIIILISRSYNRNNRISESKTVTHTTTQ